MDFPKSNGAIPNGAVPTTADIRINDGNRRAALLLVESLMHFLVSKGIISREDFIEIVDVAADVECGSADARLSQSDSPVSLIYPLAAAFRRECGR